MGIFKYMYIYIYISRSVDVLELVGWRIVIDGRVLWELDMLDC